MPRKKPAETNPETTTRLPDQEYSIRGLNLPDITLETIFKHSSSETLAAIGSAYEVQPLFLDLQHGLFTTGGGGNNIPEVRVADLAGGFWLSCPCAQIKTHLCPHQAQVLKALIMRPEFRIYFDKQLRYAKIKPVAQEYGLAQEENLDQYFALEYFNKNIAIKPRLKELLPVNPEAQAQLKEQLTPKIRLPEVTQITANRKENEQLVVVLAEHKYYKHLFIELYQAGITQAGKLKNPLKNIGPTDLIWQTDKPEEIKFYSAISRFQHNYETEPSEADLEALKAMVKNPMQLGFYLHQSKTAGNISASSLEKIKVQNMPANLGLEVVVKDQFYEITGSITLQDLTIDLQKLQVKQGYFIQVKQALYLMDNPDLLRIISFFKKHDHKILIHESKFEEFRETVLASLEAKIKINYAYLKPATEKQVEDFNETHTREQIIYLSESEDFILLTPVMKYGPLEIPVQSRKQIYGTDARGQAFTIERDENAEQNLAAAILKQHPYFYEQLHLDCFYLHRDRFLTDGWFLEAFDAWHKLNITVLGFKELKNNTLNPHQAKIHIQVTSGINWFDTAVKVKFGQQEASVKYLHQAIRNKSRFVQLGDGTQGILPEAWLEKFTKYFAAGEVVGEHIRTPKINYSVITELYETEVLDPEVQTELAYFRQKLANFEKLPEAEVPAELNAMLRDYQKQGLNWLTFLDQFNFGGCLADDMGLGKTVQILAFILTQRTQVKQNTNLVVVPTSLLFNWQEEVAKFAPSITVKTIFGSQRVKNIAELNQYELVLTSYGTLLSDIQTLKNYPFNYIFLDESQSIKNPETERYRAVRLLQSRNKVVLTGTPIENNTFDLYGQLSFACPGLLGNKRFFRDHYSTPIDKFKDSRRAAELQRKVSPFILRRTKEQVAQEPPAKTEMVIYCEMGTEQRRIYANAEREIRDFISAQGDGEIVKNSMHVLRGLTQLRQICNSPALLTGGDYSLQTSAKIETLLEQIESKAPHHKILVFSQFVTMLELIKKELVLRKITFALLTGQTQNRAAAVQAFQNDASVRVFLISLKAGGTGLNLTRADYVYLVDPWWNPAVENQAIDRVYRIGQDKNVVAVRLLCPGTVEEKIQKLQESKKELVKEVIKTDNGVLKGMSKKELLGLFG